MRPGINRTSRWKKTGRRREEGMDMEVFRVSTGEHTEITSGTRRTRPKALATYLGRRERS